MRWHLRGTCAALVGASILASNVSAQGGPPGQTVGWSQGVDVGAIYQADADIDGTGSFSVTRAFLGADFTRTMDAKSSIGFGLGFGTDSYDFADISEPWSDIRRFNASLAYARRFDNDWGIRIAPTIELSGENGASASESLNFGAIVAATRMINQDLQLGLGVGVFSGLEETRAFPFIAIRWKISPKWTLQNPFRAGPAGPAGLELVRSSDTWELAFGGAYRSFRFRLDEDNAISSGIGEFSGVPVFVRASRDLSSSWQLDLYAGATVAGTLELEDKSGRGLAKSDFDPTPIVAVTFNGRF